MSNSNSGGEGFGMVFLALGAAALVYFAVHVVGIAVGWDKSPPPPNSAYPHTSNRGVFD